MTPLRRVRAILGLNKTIIPILLARSKAIYNAMEGHKATLFSSPPVPYPTFLAQIADLDTAEQAVDTGTHGTAAIRDTKRDTLVTTLESQRSYVQSLADVSPEQAKILIESAAMLVSAAPKRSKPLLEAVLVQPSGTVVLRANAGVLTAGMGKKRPTFHWEYTLDGGKSFVSAGSTPVASTSITGLTPLTTVGFRVAVSVSKAPQAPWSQVVSILIH